MKKRMFRYSNTCLAASALLAATGCKFPGKTTTATTQSAASSEIEEAARVLENTAPKVQTLEVADSLEQAVVSSPALANTLGKSTEDVANVAAELKDRKDSLIADQNEGKTDPQKIQVRANAVFEEQSALAHATSTAKEIFRFITSRGGNVAEAKAEASEIESAMVTEAAGKSKMRDILQNSSDAEKSAILEQDKCSVAMALGPQILKGTFLAMTVGIGYVAIHSVSSANEKIRTDMFSGLPANSPSPGALHVDPVSINGLLNVDIANLDYKKLNPLQVASILAINPDDLLLMTQTTTPVTLGNTQIQAVQLGKLNDLTDTYCTSMPVTDVRDKLLVHLQSSDVHMQAFADFISANVKETLTERGPFPNFYRTRSLVHREYQIFSENTRNRNGKVEVVLFPNTTKEQVLGAAATCDELKSTILSNRNNIEASRAL